MILKRLLFLLVAVPLSYFALYEDGGTTETNIKRGILAAYIVFVAHGTIIETKFDYFGKLQWLWRGSTKLCIGYLLFLVVIAFQNIDDARYMMRYLDPKLGSRVTKDMHTYDNNCEFEWINLYDNMDHYFVIHLINWFCAAIIVRDLWLLHFWSVLDEILELSWQHILPHFRECWWDHVLLDVLLSNTPAIFLGYYAVKLCKWKEYDWLGRKGVSGFTKWRIWHEHHRLVTVSFALAIICLNFLAGFFMINSLWIPPKTWINIFRLVIWFIMANLTFREAYHNIEVYNNPEERDKNPAGKQHRWLISVTVLVEILISWKFRYDTGNIINAEWPLYITLPWFGVIGSGIIYYFYLKSKAKKSKKHKKKNALTDKKSN